MRAPIVIACLILVSACLILVSACEGNKTRLQDLRENERWNERAAYFKTKADEIDYCKERGGVPITEGLKNDPYSWTWATPPTVVQLVRCDFPLPTSLRGEQ